MNHKIKIKETALLVAVKIMREFHWPMLYGKTIMSKDFLKFVE